MRVVSWQSDTNKIIDVPLKINLSAVITVAVFDSCCMALTLEKDLYMRENIMDNISKIGKYEYKEDRYDTPQLICKIGGLII